MKLRLTGEQLYASEYEKMKNKIKYEIILRSFTLKVTTDAMSVFIFAD